jgi:oxygen-dependent protoporphyrinogen oxidase
VIPRRAGDEDESIGTFVRAAVRRGGRGLSRRSRCWLAFTPATSNACRCARSFPRLLEAERQSGSVLRAFRALRVTPSPQGAFVSLPGGTGELVDTLLASMPGVVRTNARVTELRRAGSLVIESSLGRLDARAVILGRARLRHRLAPALVRYDDRGLLRRRELCVDGHRRLRLPARSNRTSDARYRVRRAARRTIGSARGNVGLFEVAGRAPDGHVLLRGFLGGGRDPHRLDASDDELVEIARTELGDLLGISGDPVITRLFRWTRQSPQYEVGHLQRVAAIDEHLVHCPASS